MTPGVAISDNILHQKSNNYLASLYFEKNSIGIALIDISTGEFITAQGNSDYIDKLLQSFAPSEVIYPKSRHTDFKDKYGDRFYTYTLDDWPYSGDYATETLLKALWGEIFKRVSELISWALVYCGIGSCHSLPE